jgi:ribosomal-protein-alanine N-acetyltransferase
MTLRTLFSSDLPHLVLIEQNASVVPWATDVFKACFDAGYTGWVYEMDSRIIGFVIVSMNMEECHIMNLCVAREYQHQGYGFKLLNYALIHAKTHGIALAFLEVRQSNMRAIKLYQKMKFQLIGERKDYYPTLSGRENAHIFALSLHDYESQ